ncbi:Uncharacterised protein [Mycobacteroides abscessus subsp. abscessus]|nr:Uncharacterised protein [Mycobacteroides abscessus subsp. abscessus]
MRRFGERLQIPEQTVPVGEPSGSPRFGGMGVIW